MYYKRISLDIYIALYSFSRILSFILKTSWITRQEQGKKIVKQYLKQYLI